METSSGRSSSDEETIGRKRKKSKLSHFRTWRVCTSG